MINSPKIDPYEEYINADHQMNVIQDKIRKLCDKGSYDEAQQITDEELIPAWEKWRTSLYDFLSNVRKMSK